MDAARSQTGLRLASWEADRDDLKGEQRSLPPDTTPVKMEQGTSTSRRGLETRSRLWGRGGGWWGEHWM